MSFTNILISWSKSPQYISNERERSKRSGREERVRRRKERLRGNGWGKMVNVTERMEK